MSRERRRIVREEIETWREAGLIDEETARRLEGRYHEEGGGAERASDGSVLLSLGGIVLGFGVAATLERALLDECQVGWSAMSVAAVLSGLGLTRVGNALHSRPGTGRALIASATILWWQALGNLLMCYRPERVSPWYAVLAVVFWVLAYGGGSRAAMWQGQLVGGLAALTAVGEYLDPMEPGPYWAALGAVGLATLLAARLAQLSRQAPALRVAPLQQDWGAVYVIMALFTLARAGYHEGDPTERVVFSALHLVVACSLVWLGSCLGRRSLRGIGMGGLIVEVFMIHEEYLQDHLSRAAFFIALGLLLVILGSRRERLFRRARPVEEDREDPGG